MTDGKCQKDALITPWQCVALEELDDLKPTKTHWFGMS